QPTRQVEPEGGRVAGRDGGPQRDDGHTHDPEERDPQRATHLGSLTHLAHSFGTSPSDVTSSSSAATSSSGTSSTSSSSGGVTSSARRLMAPRITRRTMPGATSRWTSASSSSTI